MGRKVANDFELEVFEQKENSSRGLVKYLSVYTQHFAPRHRTDTNELIHYFETPLSGRRIIYFGLLFEGKPCGFCTLMYYKDNNVGIFDFIVISPNRRGHGAFFAFANFISAYMESKSIIPNYLVAEVLKDDRALSSGLQDVFLIKLLRMVRFRRAKIKYFSPDPIIVTDKDSCAAYLMVSCEPDCDALTKKEFLDLLKFVYDVHYLEWYKGVMPEDSFELYKKCLFEEINRQDRELPKGGKVILNGVKDLEYSLDPRIKKESNVWKYISIVSTLVTIALGYIQDYKIVILIAAAVFLFLVFIFLFRFAKEKVTNLFCRRQ